MAMRIDAPRHDQLSPGIDAVLRGAEVGSDGHDQPVANGDVHAAGLVRRHDEAAFDQHVVHGLSFE